MESKDCENPEQNKDLWPTVTKQLPKRRNVAGSSSPTKYSRNSFRRDSSARTMHSSHKKTSSLSSVDDVGINLNENNEHLRNASDVAQAILNNKSLIREVKLALNLITIPLLILAAIGIGFILIWAEEILVPFVVALFFTYLLRPLVNFLSRPWGSCNKLTCKFYRNQGIAYKKIQMSTDNLVELSPSSGTNNSPTNNPEIPDDSSLNKRNIITSSFEISMPPSTETSSVLGNTIMEHDTIKTILQSDFANTTCDRCKTFTCPKWMTVTIAMLVAFSMFAGLGVLIVDAVQTFEQSNLDDYEERTVEVANSLLAWLKNTFDIDGSYMLKQIHSEFQVVQFTKSFLSTTFNAIAYTFIVFLFVLYMLFEDGLVHTDNGISRSQSRAADLRKQIDNQIQRYLVVKTVISAFVGLLVYIVLGPFLSVKMAHLFGVITFLANFIPNVGAILATLLPLPIAILDPTQSTANILLCFLLPVLIHTVVGNFVEPKVFGDQMELHPVVVLLSLSFWFTVWGIPGAILSVPMTAVIRIIVSHFRHPYARVALRLLEGKLPGSSGFHH